MLVSQEVQRGAQGASCVAPGKLGLDAFGEGRGNPACRGTLGGRRKAVRDRLALQGGTGDFP